ncbi:Structural maintenance of chromosomes protein 5 [Tulasnella sp. JGI-2019a]|nr:Structural maintenance of chromosomes protein 5 [Tulasnella sp. JGI-2019a]
MPRARDTSDEVEENSRASTTKVKKERLSRSKKRVVEEEDDEEDSNPANREEGDDDDDEEEERGTPSGHKRSRTDVNGGLVKKNRRGRVQTPETDDGEGEENGPSQAAPKPQPQTLPRGADGYIPGSVVRVRLCNFLTYEGPVEFHPGPFLNMIIGANGTGKSSVACAIAIGLGWNPKVLGRAEELKDFVKIGNEKGWVEIELKGPAGKKNLVIRREINTKTNGSIWHLNKESATLAEIKAKVEALNVQVTNFCSFLPQDKVASFARMTPQQLLLQTQLAAGDKSLPDWHKELIEKGEELQKHLSSLDGDAIELQQLEDKNKELERDVVRWQERCRLEREVELWEIIVLATEYKVMKARYHEIKNERATLHAKWKLLRERDQPLLDLKTEYQEKAKSLLEQRKKEEGVASKRFRDLVKKGTECETEDSQADDLYKRLDVLKTSDKQRKGRIAKLKEEIATLEEKVANPPQVEDVKDINLDSDQLRLDSAGFHEEYAALEERKRRHAEQTGAYRFQLRDSQTKLADLSNVTKQRLENLRAADADCAETIEWLRKPENAQRFRVPVTEPAYVSLDIPDLAYVDHVEACISWGQLKTFVCGCEEDYKLLNRLVNDTNEALGRRGRITAWFRPMDVQQLQHPPMTNDIMQQLGFDGYAIDFVTAPPSLMWFLKKDLNMHRTAIALDGARVNQAQAIEIVSKGSGSTTFMAGPQSYRVSRSNYGRKLAQTSTGSVSPARNLKHGTVDPEKKAEYEAMIEDATAKLSEQEKGDEEIGALQKVIDRRRNEFQKREDGLKKRREKRKQLSTQIEGTKLKLQSTKTRLTGEESTPSVEEETKSIKQKLARVAEKRAKLVVQSAAITRELLELQSGLTRTAIQWLQAHSNHQALEALANNHNSAVVRAHKAFNAINEEFEEIKKTSLEVAKNVAARREALDDELKQQWKAMSEGTGGGIPDSVEIAREQLQERKDKAEAIVVNDPNAIRQYEERLKKINALRDVVDNKRRREEQLQRTIKKTRDKWYPALTTLVDNIGAKFSKAFSDIGCAGEIRLAEHEQYSNWAIEIYVKFRENEELQLLTGFRQSGGERSLTTIMYLMSLTELSRAPFSLVDEINQGMDAKAERVVHNQLVNVTCKDEAGQYFLITPKLLPNLKYHPRMRVLCVSNGEWTPEDARYGNLKGLIKSHVKKSAAARAAAT